MMRNVLITLFLLAVLLASLHFLSLHHHLDPPYPVSSPVAASTDTVIDTVIGTGTGSATGVTPILHTQQRKQEAQQSEASEVNLAAELNDTLFRLREGLERLKKELKSKQDSSGRADDAVVTPPTASLSKPSASASASGDGQQEVVGPLSRQRPPRSSSSSSSVLDPAQTPPVSPPPPPSKVKDNKSNGKVCIFTMDSIPSYEENSKRGGAAGELIIRHSLEEAFASFGLTVTVLGSDAAFDKTALRDYRIILLDPWTWAMKGWRPKRQLLGLEEKIYLLDFFGASRLKGQWPELSPKHFLTAFPTPWNTFLGYKIPEERLSLSWSPSVLSSAGGASGGVEKSSNSERRIKGKQLQGVIWGKDPKHFAQSSSFIKILADHVPLVTTLSPSVSRGVLPVHANISFAGHLRPEAWLELLAGSRFLLGLGHPLLGPSALDAVSVGCLFINPVYPQPQLEAGYRSQHAYLAEKLPSHVCDYPVGNAAAALECVERAVRVDLPAVIPEDMREEVYLDRVKKIFHL